LTLNLQSGRYELLVKALTSTEAGCLKLHSLFCL